MYWKIFFKTLPISQPFEQMRVVFSRAAISGLIFVSRILTVKKILIGRGLFLNFSSFKYFVIYWQEFEITVPLLIDLILKKWDPTNIFYGFRVKLCFTVLWILAILFIKFYGLLDNLKLIDKAFSCYLMALTNLKIYVFVLGKCWLILELCHYFILFLSTSGLVSVQKGWHPFPVICKLVSVTVLRLTNGFLILKLWVNIFFYFWA